MKIETRTPMLAAAILLLASAALVKAASPAATEHRRDAPPPRITRVGPIPIRFEQNIGQSDSRVKFLSRSPRHLLFLTGDSIVTTVQGSDSHGPSVTRMRLVGADPEAMAEGLDRFGGTTSYYIGRDQSRWRRNVPAFGRAMFHNVYPDIDLVFYESDGRHEYDFVVAPGADPGVIEMAFEGYDDVSIDEQGDLVLRTASGEVRQRRPLVYEETAGRKHIVTGHYRLNSSGNITLELGRYDPSLPLVIDPKIEMASYIGGSVSDTADAVAVDQQNRIWVAGQTISTNFPALQGETPPEVSGGFDTYLAVFEEELDGNGSRWALTRLAFLGGGGTDRPTDIDISDQGDVLVAGLTDSPDFAVTDGSTAKPGFNVFLAVARATAGPLDIGPTTVRGAPVEGNEIQGQPQTLWVRGSEDLGGGLYAMYAVSHSLLSTQPPPEDEDALGIAVLLKLSETARFFETISERTLDRTIAREPETREPFDISLGYQQRQDQDDQVCAGSTTKTEDIRHPFLECFDAFLTNAGMRWIVVPPDDGNLDLGHISAALTSGFLDITFNGTDMDLPVVESQTPLSPSSLDAPPASAFGPPKVAAFQGSNPGDQSVAVLRLDLEQPAVTKGTFLGGSGADTGTDMDVASGCAVVTGRTGSTDFLVTEDAPQPNHAGGFFDAFVSKVCFDDPENEIVYSTYLGGPGVDDAMAVAAGPNGKEVVVGATTGDFPVTADGLQPVYGGGPLDGYLAVLYKPLLRKQAILGAADFAARGERGLAPQEIVTIFISAGPRSLLTLTLDENGEVTDQLGPTRVLLNGEPVPLLSAALNQVSFVSPGSLMLNGKQEVSIEVEVDGQLSNSAVLPVVEANPAIFSLTSTGTGQGAILNPDFSVNGGENPSDSFIVVYGTGGGEVDPPCPDGALAPSVEPLPRLQQSQRVLVDGVDAMVLYAGSAPGLVCGVNQWNVVPTNDPSGPAVPIQVCSGEVCSQEGITAAFR